MKDSLAVTCTLQDISPTGILYRLSALTRLSVRLENKKSRETFLEPF